MYNYQHFRLEYLIVCVSLIRSVKVSVKTLVGLPKPLITLPINSGALCSPCGENIMYIAL